MWRDIDSVPKDGTLFDVWAYGERYTNCMWTLPYKAPPTAVPEICEYMVVDYDGITGWDPVGAATHWMEIPKGPEE